MRWARVAALVAASLAAVGCGDEPETFVFVTVEARPAVRAMTSLEVMITNDNTTLMESFDVEDEEFPVTFTVTATNRVGDIAFAVEGVDEDGQKRALGAGSGTIVADERVDVTVLLEPTDFVVNSSIAGEQRLTFAQGRAGRQVASRADGAFSITFVNDCATLGRCDVFGRMFDPDSTPAVNDITMTDAEFIVNQTDEFTAVPSIAVGTTGTLVVWETNIDIRGAMLSPAGAHVGFSDTIISTGTDFPFDANVAPLPTGEFAVVWTESTLDGSVVRGRLIGADGQPAINPVNNDTSVFDVSTDAMGNAQAPVVAATGDGLGHVVAWRDGGDIIARFFGSDGLPRPAQQVVLVSAGVSGTLAGPQLAWDGNAAVVVWGITDFTDNDLENGRFRLRRFAPPTGVPVGPEVSLTETTPDTISNPAVTPGPDGSVLVAWHDCGASGDDSGCGVFAQVVRRSNMPIGEPFSVNSTQVSDQTDPAAAAVPDGFVVTWSDASQQEPDTSEGAVRARVVYPATDPNDGTKGARCGQAEDAPCGDGLVCMAGSQSPVCHVQCDPVSADPCPGGGICTTAGDESACVF